MTYFRVDPEHLVAHRPADTYDVIHADNYELVIANVTHQQATFIASVLNGRTEADIKAEALREAADDLERRINDPGLILMADQYAGYHAGERARGQREVDVLRARADRLAGGETE